MPVIADYDEGDCVYIDLHGTWNPMGDDPPFEVLFFGTETAREIWLALGELFNHDQTTNPLADLDEL